MKPFWKKTVGVLKFICKFFTWLTGEGTQKDDAPGQ